jgi:hypothetical protein
MPLMNNASLINRAAGLLDAAGRDPGGVLSPTAATRSLQAADELHRAGARPILDSAPMPPKAAIREALRLLSSLPAEEFQSDAVLECVDHAQRAFAATR